MTMRLVLGALWVLLATLSARASCQALPDQRVHELSAFVQQRYRLSFNVTVLPSDVSLDAGTCYRKLRFTPTETVARPYALSLYLSPDLRFLSRDLMDSTTDSLEADRAANEKTLTRLDSNSSPQIGPRNAAVTITLFSDFECPFCREQAKILREKVLPSEPDVRLVFKYMPLSFHPWSQSAAELAACVAVQDANAFWQLHDFIFAHQSQITPSSLNATVKDYLSSLPGVKMDQFNICVDSGATNTVVARDMALAKELGIEATPSLFVNAFRVNGVATAEQLQSLIRQVESHAALPGAAASSSQSTAKALRSSN